VLMLDSNQMNIRFSCALIFVSSLLAIGAWSVARAQAAPSFSINWHVISSGGTNLSSGNMSQSSCFIVNGTLAQAAPGYSSGGIYSVYAGFWAAAPTVNTDEIFFNGFEGCSP
jgi:hypothetical protein